MSFLPFVSFKSRFVTYLLNFPRICLLDLFTVSAAGKGNRAQVFDVLWFWSVLYILVDWFMCCLISNQL